MRRLSVLIVILTFLGSCKSEHAKEYLTFSGTIENSVDSTLTIQGNGLTKIIKISEDGTFKDTLKVSEARLFNLYSSSNARGIVFLKNGYEVTILDNMMYNQTSSIIYSHHKSFKFVYFM
mgnify:CR=1 FL=1